MCACPCAHAWQGFNVTVSEKRGNFDQNNSFEFMVSNCSPHYREYNGIRINSVPNIFVLVLIISYVTCKLYRLITAFNILREIAPFLRHCHNIYVHYYIGSVIQNC